MKYISVDYLVDLHCVTELHLHLHGVWMISAVKIGIYWLLIMKKKSLDLNFRLRKKCSIKKNFYPLWLLFHFSQFCWQMQCISWKFVVRKMCDVNYRVSMTNANSWKAVLVLRIEKIHWSRYNDYSNEQRFYFYYAIIVRSVGSL